MNVTKENKSISQVLADISMIMSDGYKFILLRTACERWEQEAKTGNVDSQTLITMISQFLRIITIASK